MSDEELEQVFGKVITVLEGFKADINALHSRVAALEDNVARLLQSVHLQAHKTAQEKPTQEPVDVCPKCGAKRLTAKEKRNFKPEDAPEQGRPTPDWYCGSFMEGEEIEQSRCCRVIELEAENAQEPPIEAKLKELAGKWELQSKANYGQGQWAQAHDTCAAELRAVLEKK